MAGELNQPTVSDVRLRQVSGNWQAQCDVSYPPGSNHGDLYQIRIRFAFKNDGTADDAAFADASKIGSWPDGTDGTVNTPAGADNIYRYVDKIVGSLTNAQKATTGMTITLNDQADQDSIYNGKIIYASAQLEVQP